MAQPAAVPTFDDILSALVDRPDPRDDAPAGPVPAPAWFERSATAPRTNYLAQEAANRSLGSAGEEFVQAFERARIVAAGHDRLAASVERVSLSRGDAVGFDILSFDADGRERLVEVKTTRYVRHTPFFLSRNELRTSDTCHDRYSLYRLFHFRVRPQLFILPGALRASCQIEAVAFEARVA